MVSNIAAANKQNIQIEAEETGVIDLPLRDNKGNMHHLTDLRGKVVLLNFHAFSLPDSPEYIMQMRELYDKYHTKGLEIYMVSLDDNEHFWKESVANLPWINVYDNTGISEAYTSAATATPIIYLIDRNNIGAIVQREDLSVEKWTNPEIDVRIIKAKERYGIGIMDNGKGIAVAKNISAMPSFPRPTVVRVTE